MTKLKDKTILITGGASGIGKIMSRLSLERDANVIIWDINIQNIENTLKELSDLGNISTYVVDVSNLVQIQETAKKIKDEHGNIDILINNAGYGLVSTVEEVTEEEMFRQFNINVFAVMRMCKAVIPQMREQQDGLIINISSFLGKIGLPLLTFYNASKYAVEGITDSLRYELRDFNIRVHSIMPGFFDTNFARDNLVLNLKTFQEHSPYASLVSKLAPVVVQQINAGNDTMEVAQMILEIIEDDNALARQTAGDKAKKFIPMKKELSDEDFERRVRAYYDL